MEKKFRTPSLKFFLSALTTSALFFTSVCLLWPYYKFYIDPDAISYLTISKNYLHGNIHEAINAYWSPMGCWLTAVWAKYTGCSLFASAICVNAIGGGCALLSGQILFNKFRTIKFEQWCFGLSTALFWAYVVYFQSFTDVWQCFFLILGLGLLLKENFEKKPILWVLVGCVAACAYFSKAYSFYFFPLMIILVSGMKLHLKNEYRLKKHLQISVFSIFVMLIIAAPWLYLLHDKYGFWTTSTAGKLNLTWWLTGTQNTKQGIGILMPPPYKKSLFYFEDPLLVQGHFVHFWDSLHLFLKFLIRIGYNAFQWVISSNKISAFYFITWLVVSLSLLQRAKSFFENKSKILVVVFFVFPLPYWLLTFDNGRYLWFTVPLSMIIGLIIFEKFFFKFLSKKTIMLFTLIFFLTFLVTPVINLKKHFKSGYTQHNTAQKLKALNIKGAFVSNLSYAKGKDRLTKLAWFSQNAWYCHRLDNFSTKMILEDAARYHVKYYFYFFEGTDKNYQLKKENGQVFLELTHGRIPGLKVFLIH